MRPSTSDVLKEVVRAVHRTLLVTEAILLGGTLPLRITHSHVVVTSSRGQARGDPATVLRAVLADEYAAQDVGLGMGMGPEWAHIVVACGCTRETIRLLTMSSVVAAAVRKVGHGEYARASDRRWTYRAGRSVSASAAEWESTVLPTALSWTLDGERDVSLEMTVDLLEPLRERAYRAGMAVRMLHRNFGLPPEIAALCVPGCSGG